MSDRVLAPQSSHLQSRHCYRSDEGVALTVGPRGTINNSCTVYGDELRIHELGRKRSTSKPAPELTPKATVPVTPVPYASSIGIGIYTGTHWAWVVQDGPSTNAVGCRGDIST